MLRPYTDGVPIATQGRPVVVDSNYPVQVVGHHNEGVQPDAREVRRDLEPTLGRRCCETPEEERVRRSSTKCLSAFGVDTYPLCARGIISLTL